MKYLIFPDIHIQAFNSCPHFQLLKSFLSHPHTVLTECEGIIFLGDTIDFFLGGFKEFFHEYRFFFELLESIADRGIKIFLIDGNHDYYFSFEKNYSYKNIFFVQKTLALSENFHEVIFAHGDLLNPHYSPLVYLIRQFLSEDNYWKDFLLQILPYAVIKKIGEEWSMFSKNSQLSKIKSFKDQGLSLDLINQMTIEKYKNLLKEYFSLNQSKARKIFFIYGHIHAKNEFSPNENIFCINPGLFPRNKEVLFLDLKEGMYRFEAIEK